MSVEEIEKYEMEDYMPPEPVKKNPGRPKKQKDEDLVVETSFLETDKYILEQVVSATHAKHATHTPNIKFIILNKETGTTDEKVSFEYQNKLFKPITSTLLDQGIVKLPTGIEEYGSTEKLIEEIKEFMFSYFEAPKFYEQMLPYLVLFYWVYDKFPFIPYLHFMGLTGTGKSTAMDIVGSICYKPTDASGAITLASIFRVASMWRGTLLLDEFTPGGDGYKEMLALLKSGVSDRAVLRVEGDKKREVVGYLVKSPKIFTSEKPITDAGLRSRVMEIKMEKNKRKVPLYRRKNFEEVAQKLRNKLLLWRLRSLNDIDLSEIEYGFKELQAFDGRVQQVITPVYYLADDKAKSRILNFAGEQQKETLRERREALDGQIFEILIEHKDNPPSIVNITEMLNKNSTRPITEKRTANTIRKILGFDIQRVGHDNISTPILENQEDRLKELCEYYGLESGVCVASVASVAEDDENDQEKEVREIFDF